MNDSYKNIKENHVFWKIISSATVVVNMETDSLVIFSNSGRAKDETLSTKLLSPGQLKETIKVHDPVFRVKVEPNWKNIAGGKILAYSCEEELSCGLCVKVKSPELPDQRKWYTLDNFDYSRLYVLLSESSIKGGELAEDMIPVTFIQNNGRISFTSPGFEEYPSMKDDLSRAVILSMSKKTKKFKIGREYTNEKSSFVYLGKFQNTRGGIIPFTIKYIDPTWTKVSDVFINSLVSDNGSVDISNIALEYAYSSKDLPSSCELSNTNLTDDIGDGQFSPDIFTKIVDRIYSTPGLFGKYELPESTELTYISSLDPVRTILSYIPFIFDTGKIGKDTKDKVVKIIEGTATGLMLKKVSKNTPSFYQDLIYQAETSGDISEYWKNLPRKLLNTIYYEPITNFTDSITYFSELVTDFCGQDISVSIEEIVKRFGIFVTTNENRAKFFKKLYDLGNGFFLYDLKSPHTTSSITINIDPVSKNDFDKYVIKSLSMKGIGRCSDSLYEILREMVIEADKTYGKHINEYTVRNYGTLKNPKLIYRFDITSLDIMNYLDREKSGSSETESLKSEVAASPYKYYILKREVN